MEVVKKTEGLKKISFLSHSLGGLFARYAIAVLYTPHAISHQSDDLTRPTPEKIENLNFLNKGFVAGLEAINFITLATPHLGVRGNKQMELSIFFELRNLIHTVSASIRIPVSVIKTFNVSSIIQLPFLLGVPLLEKLAAPLAPIFTGRTGRQLFLTDGKSNRPPLLLRMTCDCADGKFISSLGAFRCRVLYANVSYDHMVGWRTSSIRREKELCKPPSRSLDGYKHVVDVNYCPPVLSEGPDFPPEAARAKEAAQKKPSIQNTVEYHEIMEEQMIRGLQQVGWMKVDVSFHSAFWPFFAHNNIHVKNEWFHNAGVGVVAHVADTIRQQEEKLQNPSSSYIAASL
ncbi:alpha/beta-Hydrolases superfamily protein [Striga asiatica]|uniref:Alpha/beta-Hydrolases superfamily protein n=1 Tax=Striga asiatica TaxID=4170 RepID=A0A5A7R1M0_STRAF|nr:alpha/beta-Hydrolases superfamily protein [Striga asiatica]